MKRPAVLILISYCAICSLASGQSKQIATVAGNGIRGSSGDGGSPTAAELNQPGGIAVDASGDLFIADTTNNRIQEVLAGGSIITVTGSGGLPFSPPLYQPGGVAVDAAGDLFIADTGNSLIREVSASGVITTVAGGGSEGFYGDAGPATAAALWSPAGIFVDGSGNLFIADSVNNRIREVSASNGYINTVAGSTLGGFSGDGGPATSAMLNNPTGVFVDASGNIYIADNGNNRIRKVSSGGTITTIAGTGIEGFSGDGGPAISASLYNPADVVVDASGNIFIAVALSNRIRMISASNGGIPTLAARSPGTWRISWMKWPIRHTAPPAPRPTSI